MDHTNEVAFLMKDHDHNPYSKVDPNGNFQGLLRELKVTLEISTEFVGTDISDEVEMITNTKGSTVIFYNGFKYIKSGESKTSFQYRCMYYMKKCRSRIVLNRESEILMKNEIPHNHEEDPALYESFTASAVEIRHFGRNTESR